MILRRVIQAEETSSSKAHGLDSSLHTQKKARRPVWPESQGREESLTRRERGGPTRARQDGDLTPSTKPWEGFKPGSDWPDLHFNNSSQDSVRRSRRHVREAVTETSWGPWQTGRWPGPGAAAATESAARSGRCWGKSSPGRVPRPNVQSKRRRETKGDSPSLSIFWCLLGDMLYF